MGGCASKPKACEVHQREPAPSEAPASPEPAVDESVAQEKTSDGGEGQNEAPLVDLSEAKKEEGENSTETKAAEAEVIVSTEAAGDVTAVLAEDKAEVTLEKPEDKVKVEVVEETKETPKKEQVEAKKAEDLATTPASDDKKDAPVVTL